GELGTIPTLGLGAGLSAGVLHGRLRGELLAIGEASRSVPLTDKPGVGARVGSFRAGARGCFAALEGTLEIAPCLGMEIAWLNGRGYGIATPAEGSTKWVEVVGGALLRWALTPAIGLRAEAIAQIPLRRQDLVIAPYGTVHTVPSLTGRAAF